jgi:DNA polymerase III epsilon subunit family exonuclease
MSIQDVTAQAPAITASAQSLSDTVFVAFDTETTGLNPVVARLVEISGVKFLADGTVLSTFETLINPQTPIPEPASAVHGITDEMVADAPLCGEAIPAFFSWATATNHCPNQRPNVLVAHNAPFDISFLEIAMCRLQMPLPSNTVLDTLTLARQLIADSPNYQLRTLVEHLGLESDGYHRALADSHHVRKLLLAMIGQLGKNEPLSTLIQIGGRLTFIDRSQPQEGSRWAEDPDVLTIRRALDAGQDLRIVYSGVRKGTRTVTPLSVLITAGAPYLTAYCHLAAAERTFRIDRIVQMETLEPMR